MVTGSGGAAAAQLCSEDTSIAYGVLLRVLQMNAFDYTRPPVAIGAVGLARRAMDEGALFCRKSAIRRRNRSVHALPRIRTARKVRTRVLQADCADRVFVVCCSNGAALQYAHERKTMGQPIAQHQVGSTGCLGKALAGKALAGTEWQRGRSEGAVRGAGTTMAPIRESPTSSLGKVRWIGLPTELAP